MMIKAHCNDMYTTVSRYIHGVLFFGTPHRGSDIASWGTIFSNVLRVGSFGTSTNSSLIKELQRNSRTLDMISRSFADCGKDVNIVSFYETEAMDYLGCLVIYLLESMALLQTR